MLPDNLWTALGLALGSLLAASALVAAVPRVRSLPILAPLGAGYVLGGGGLGLLDGELAALAVQFALGIGAGWIALDASSSALATLKRSTSRSAVYWAIAYALVGPSIIAAGMAPLAVSVLGAGGLALHALAVTGVAGALPDASPFKSSPLSKTVPSEKLREAVRTSDALHAAVLAAFPIYWGVARALASGEGLLADVVLASIGASIAIGLALGLAAYFLMKFLKPNLAIAAVLVFLTVKAAVLADMLHVSAVATCFLAGVIIGQDTLQSKSFTAIAHNLRHPFLLVMLLAAGASAPAWRGASAPLLIIAVVLAGRFVIGKIADTLASTMPNAADGRHFAWLVAVPSALSVAMVVEGSLLLGDMTGMDPAAATGSELAGATSASLGAITHGDKNLTLVAPFLLAIGLGDLFARRLVERGYPRALAKEKAAASASASSREEHRRHGRRRRPH